MEFSEKQINEISRKCEGTGDLEERISDHKFCGISLIYPTGAVLCKYVGQHYILKIQDPFRPLPGTVVLKIVRKCNYERD